MRPGFAARGLGAALMACILFSAAAYACGLSWSKPGSHFDGVDYQGDVYLVEEIGEFDLGKGNMLPIFAAFESSNMRISPYLGSGWVLPLLEAKIVPVDEKTFRLDQPDGRFRIFWRDKDDPSLLSGQGGWKAEIQGDVLRAWAPCGSRMAFRRGRIMQLEVKGRKLDYVYSGSTVSEIREAGTSLLKVLRDSKTSDVTGLAFSSGKTVGFEQGRRPRVQSIGGQNVVVGIDRSLGKIILPGGKTRAFEFAVDGLLQPMVKIDGSREVVWNPATGKIIRDGEWAYQIDDKSLPSEKFAAAAIARTDHGGKRQFWSETPSVKSFTKLHNGVNVTERTFPSGMLAGKLRSVRYDLGDRILEEKYAYDEHGDVARVTMTRSDGNAAVGAVGYAYEGDSVVISGDKDFRQVIKSSDLVKVIPPKLQAKYNEKTD